MFMTWTIDKQWRTWNAVQTAMSIGMIAVLTLLMPGCHSVHVCSRFDEKCTHEDCLISTPCHHGDCDVTGNCICDPCWRGENCNHYVDEYLPTFPSTSETVIIKDPWITGSIHTVRAFDGDFGTTCPLRMPDCECAQITYSIQEASHPGLFKLDNSTGHIYIVNPMKVMAGVPHRLVIAAKGAQDTGSYSTLELFIYWRDESAANSETEKPAAVASSSGHPKRAFAGETIFQSVDDDDQLTLKRKRRSLGTENNHLTMFNLTLVNGDPMSMEIGEVLDYRLDISIPPTEQVDIIVELFTKDVGNPNYTPILILYNLIVQPAEEGVKYINGGEPKVNMILSDEYDTVYDAALLDFGMISNPGPSDAIITVTFSVTMIRHPSIESGDKYVVTAGAEYDEESYVWVGQSEVIARKLEPAHEIRDIEVDIHGPAEIALDSAGVFTLDAYLSFRSDSVTIKVSGPSDQEDVINIGNLGVKAFGSNYAPVPQSAYHYRTIKISSESNDTFKEAVMAMGLLTNVGSVGNPVKFDGNKLTVTFAVYALNKQDNIGKKVTITPNIDIGNGLKVWSEPIEVTLTPKQQVDKLTDSISTIASPAPPENGLGHLVVVTVQTTMTENSYADYRITVNAPVSKNIPLLEPCYGKMRKDLSGFNVPYVNVTPVLPTIEGNRYMFNFGRVQITDQRTPSIETDNLIILEIIVKISFHPENVDGKSHELSVAVDNTGTLLSPVKLSITVRNLEISEPPPIKLRNASPWEHLYKSGGVALEMVMQISPDTAFSDVNVQASAEKMESLPRMEICRAEINFVGDSVPCTYLHRMDININRTKYKSLDGEAELHPNHVLMSMGDVSTLQALQKREIDGQVIVTFIVNVIEDGTPVHGDATYPISIDVASTDAKLWSKVPELTLKSGPPPDLTPELAPSATARLLSDKPTAPGFLTEGEIILHVAQGSVSSYTFEVSADDDQLSICGVWIKYVGRNMPCVDVETKATYEPHTNPHLGNQKGILAFNAIFNAGKHPMEVNEDHLPDEIHVTMIVRVGPTANSDKTFTWSVKYGSSGIISDQITVPVLLDVSSVKEDVKEPKNLRMYRMNSTSSEAGIGVPFLLAMDVELETNAMAPITVGLLNPQAENNRFPYDVCLAGVMFVGHNYPCYSAVQLQSNITSSNPSTTDVTDTGLFDMGVVCHTLIDKENEVENMVQLGIAVRPVDNGHLTIGEEFSIDAVVNIGEHAYNMPTFNFMAVDLVKQTVSEHPGFLYPSFDAPTPIEVRQHLWIPFNLSIPFGGTLRVTVTATGAQTEDRAVVTIHGLRVTNAGINIPCPIPRKEPKVEYQSSFENSQTDKAISFLGYYSNFGFTHLSNTFMPGDDDLVFEVEVEMTDHPLAEHDSLQMLSVSVEMGTTELKTQHPLKVVRHGNEKASVDASVLVDTSKIYQRSETVNVGAFLKHSVSSRAEPTNVTFRFFLPPFMTFTALTYTNATGLQLPSVRNATPAGLDVTFPYLLFHDVFEFNVTLITDPENQRGYGKGEIDTTTPFRVLCNQVLRKEPVQNPSNPELLFSCSTLDHLQYQTNSQECYEPLGLEDSTIADCQISASSAATKQHSPKQVRFGSDKVWSPAVRPGFEHPYLQINFLRPTRVSKIVVKSHTNYRKVTKYSLMYSNTGKKWFTVVTNVTLHYIGDLAEDTLEHPLVGTFMRFYVEEASDPEMEDEMYIGVQLELYGCYLTKDITGICTKDDTWYTDLPEPIGRHFITDTTRDIVYFCDSPYGPMKLQCFSSTDGGSTWNVLSKTIYNFLGYDSDSGRTYASGKKGRALLATENGVTWFPVVLKVFKEVLLRDSFQPRLNVPSLTKPDFNNLHLTSGKWRASYEGLHYKDSPTPVAKWNKCCLLKP